MATVYALAFAVLGLVIMHSSLVVWTALVLPGPVARARVRLETRPVASFFAGLAFFVLTVLAYGGFRMLLDNWTSTVADILQSVTGAMHLPRFHNDEYIIANCAAWPVLGAPTMVGWIIGGGAVAGLCRPSPLFDARRPTAVGTAAGGVGAELCLFLAGGWLVSVPSGDGIDVDRGWAFGHSASACLGGRSRIDRWQIDHPTRTATVRVGVGL